MSNKKNSIWFKNKFLIIIFILLWLILVNFSSFFEFYKNNLIYKNANFLYKQKNYREALSQYNLLENNNYQTNYNIWNTIYKIWDSENDSKLKIKYWEESLNYYRKSLKIKFDEEANKNLDFIQEKIKQEKEKLKKDEEEKKQEKKGKWEKVSPHSISPKGREAEQEDSWKNKQERKLTKEWEKFIKNSEKKLKEQEKNNQNSFNKVYRENKSQNIFDNFEELFWNSQFDNSLLDKNEKKDW